MLETPPRAWGRRWDIQPVLVGIGNTPTSVGKTQRTDGRGCRVKKHPHERGEDDDREGFYAFGGETPPRAWGRHWILLVLTGGWWRFVLWLYLFFNHKGHA